MLERTVVVVGVWRWFLGVVAMASTLASSGCMTGQSTAVAPTAPVPGLLQQFTVCPASPASARATSLPGIREALLPFAPTRFVLCRYGGLNSGHSQALVQQQQVVTRAAVAALTAALQSGDSTWSATGTTGCPADFGTTTTVYAKDGPRAGWLVLHADRTGCPTIRNGSINAHIGGAPSKQLTRLVGAPGM